MRNHMNIHMLDIGEGQEEIELEPFPESVPVTEPAPQVPEKVPA
jgi:hypothetical protein